MLKINNISLLEISNILFFKKFFMKDSTKQILLIVVPCFIFGFFFGLFGEYLRWKYYIALLIIFILIMIFLSKKFTPKNLKNDEIIKKVAIMSDAIGGRAGLVWLLLYGVLYVSDFLIYLPKFSTEIWLTIIFWIMWFSAIIASIYYSHNPDKLP